MKTIIFKTCVVLLILLGLGLNLTLSLANRKEIQIEKIDIGSARLGVEQLMGSKGIKRVINCTCESPSSIVSEDHYAYRGNASLWYDRFEHTLNVCYHEGVVCSMYQTSL